MAAKWSSGPLSLRAQARYIGAMDIFASTDTVVKGAGAQTYVDLNAGVAIGKSLQILAGGGSSSGHGQDFS